MPATRIRATAAAMKATVFEVLDEWGLHGAYRDLLIRKVLQLESATNEFERDRRAKRESK